MAAFATGAELEVFMGLGTGSLGARGTAILDFASAEIRRFTGQDLEATAGRQEEMAAPYRAIISVTQIPVTAVSAITVDGVALDSDDFVWSRWGSIHKTSWENWTEGPIVITYDSGYDSASDEMAGIKQITLEMASRALAGTAGFSESFGPEVSELRGGPVGIFLTDSEMRQLEGYQRLVAA